jgi:ankyrin repeat protein
LRAETVEKTTGMDIPLQQSDGSAAARNSRPTVRQGPQLQQGQALMDAYRAPSSSSQASDAYTPPGAEQITEALKQALPSTLERMLRAAASSDDHETIKQIHVAADKLPKDADQARAALKVALDSRDANGDSVLMNMLKNRPGGSLERSRHALTLIELLLLGPDRQSADKDGNNAAMIAIKNKYPLSTIRLLLEEGKLDHADQAGDTALMTAIALKNEGLVESLLEHGASASFKAAENGESALERALNDADYDNDSIKEMLRKAAPQGRAAGTAQQRSASASPERRAFRAVAEGDRKTLEKLLQEQPSMLKAKNGAGHTLLMQAAIHGKLDIARLLRDKGAKRNDTSLSGDTALLYAIRHGHTQLANFLIEEGAKLDHANRVGQKALPYAASKAQPSVVARLLDHAADASAQLNHESLLRCAFESASLETMQVVILHLSESSEGRKQLNHGLHSCVLDGLLSSGKKALVHAELLLDAGADADLPWGDPGEGMTSLMLLAGYVGERFMDGLGMAKLLIARGAHLESRNRDGKTALDIAREHGYQPMIDLLSGNAASAANN